MDENAERWKTLCEQASIERDPEKLLELLRAEGQSPAGTSSKPHRKENRRLTLTARYSNRIVGDMAQCQVEITGKDGVKHAGQVEATSLFDAANKAMQSSWSLLWWFDSAATIIVRRNGQEWKVTQERVREWRSDD